MLCCMGSLFSSDFSFWDSVWKMKLSKGICLLWKLYPCNPIIWNLRKQNKNPKTAHQTSSLSVTPRLVCPSSKAELLHLFLCSKTCLREGKKRPGENERSKRERNALTPICDSIYCQKTLPILRKPEINPGVYVWSVIGKLQHIFASLR